jgi:hypothetical protein
VIEKGTVVIRNGIIEAVGRTIAPPADARIWALDSLTVYPGLIDLALVVQPPKKEKDDRGREGGETGASLSHELDSVTPEFVLAEHLELRESDRKERRAQGFTTVRALPGRGAFRGQAAVLNLGHGPLGRNLLRRSAGQVVAFSGSLNRDGYPSSTMGVVAVLRQTLLDARWYERAHTIYARSPVGIERPPTNAALAALSRSLEAEERFIFVADDVLDVLRAGELGQEFGISFEFVGSGEEQKRLDEVRRSAASLVVPVNFPSAPTVDDGGTALGVSLETLRAWDMAPANAARLHESGIRLALTANGLKKVEEFRGNVARAIEAGLPPEAALAAVTTVPAEMIGMSDRLGTVEEGKIANLIIADGGLFADTTRVRAVWIDGAYYETEEIEPPQGDPRGTWDMLASTSGGEVPFTLSVGGEVGALTATLSAMGSDIPATASQSGTRVVVTFPGHALGVEGTVRISFVIEGEAATGEGRTPDGEAFAVSGTRVERPTGSPERTRGGESR